LDAQPAGTQYRLNYSVVDSKVVQNKVIDPSKTPRLQVREEQKMTGSIKDIVRVRRHLINLIIMIAVWIASSFDYYLLNFQLKSIQGNIFLNTFSSAISELPAVIISGFMYKKLGIKITLVTWFSVSFLGGICLLILGKSNQDLIPIFILFSKAGVTATFNLCYLANAQIFPAIFAGTAFGICNIGAKLTTILAPMIAEV
jgi:Na+/melibiose symporter-like transporter